MPESGDISLRRLGPSPVSQDLGAAPARSAPQRARADAVGQGLLDRVSHRVARTFSAVPIFRGRRPATARRGASPAVDGAAIDLLDLEVVAKDFAVQISDWRIERGARVALIGHNGAGKTTIMDALLGLRKPVRLRGSMLGRDFAAWHRRPALRRRLGVLLTRASYAIDGVAHIVDFHRRLYGGDSGAAAEALGISPLRGQYYPLLSRGERQRLDLFMALAHRPDIAFLDEPFTGLDQQYTLAAGDLIRGLRDTTVVMACHSAAELSLASVAAWLDRGRILLCDSPQAMREKLIGEFRLHVSFATPAAAERFRRRAATELKPRFTHVISAVELSLFGSEALVTLARGLVDDAEVTAVELARATFGDLLYRCSLGDMDA